jgi:hypothetical protein
VDLQNGCQISKDKMEMYKNVIHVSFMIFRTGSVLIVGKCDEYVLLLIYEFLKNILKAEYFNICQKNTNVDSSTDFNELNQIKIDKNKKKKIRRKNIIISVSE